MPVHIEEIVFHAEVAGVQTRPERPAAERTPAQQRAEREALVEAVVAEVMRILRREGER